MIKAILIIMYHIVCIVFGYNLGKWYSRRELNKDKEACSYCYINEVGKVKND